MAGTGPLDVSATILGLVVRDGFLSGGVRKSALRSVLMPSLVVKWKVTDGFALDGFAKRSYRMPTFNDLYYTTVGSKTLEPEDALQFDLGACWDVLASGAEKQDNSCADIEPVPLVYVQYREGGGAWKRCEGGI